MRFTVAACLFLLFSAHAFAQSAPQNLDFETGTIGQPPPGWTVKAYPDDANVSAKTDSEHSQSGRASAALTVSGKSDDVAGILSQAIDATPYRGKFVMFRAAVRGAASASEVYLRIRASGPHETYYPDNSVDADRGNNWKFYQVLDFIPPDAEKIDIAFVQAGPGTSNIGSISLPIVDGSKVGFEAPRPLSPRGLENLHAFARLFGYVRFFHPSDEAAKANWSDIAIAGVQKVEDAPDSSALIAALREVFMPLAPTLRIYATGDVPPPAPSALSNPPSGATILGWQYHGVHGDGDDDKRRNGFYTSERVVMTAPLPDHLFAANLGGGVSVLMPTTLYKDDKGTLPHITEGFTAIRPDKPALFTPSGLDRATRLADIVLSWALFQNFYPYFHEEPVDMAAVLDAALSKAATDRDEYEFQHTLQKEDAALCDGHGQTMLESQKLFILPVYWEWIENRFVVMSVTPQSGGLKPGDVIDGMDGRPVDDLIAEQRPLVSASTQQSAMAKLSWLMRQTTSAAPVHIEAHRGSERIVADVTPGPVTPFSHPLNDVTELKPRIWYVDLRDLKKADLDAAMSKLESARAVIFDMRGYPSPDGLSAMAHLSDAPIHTVHFDIPITTLPDQQSVTYDDVGWAWQPQKPHFKGKIIFLTNGTAISQAEMFMSFVEDNHLGTIIGSTTAGTDGEINSMHLPGNYVMNWTGMRVLKYDGSRFMSVGISPNVPVSPTIAGIRAGRDEVLEKAIEIASAPQ